MNITITHIDTACMLLDINGFRIMTDPTLDKAGHLYYHGYGAASRKTGDPALPTSGLGEVDLILLSHHQHKDNFDHLGRAFIDNVSTVLSTQHAARDIPGITGLANWETYHVTTDKLPNLRITATPAQHHPSWIPEFVSGTVIGFVIEFDGQENGVLYITGDTVYFKGIEEVARRYKIDIGIFHVGSVQFRYLTGLGEYTMSSKGLLQSVQVLDPRIVIPIHYRGWSHFSEKESSLKKTITSHALLKDRTVFLQPGKPTIV